MLEACILTSFLLLRHTGSGLTVNSYLRFVCIRVCEAVLGLGLLVFLSRQFKLEILTIF